MLAVYQTYLQGVASLDIAKRAGEDRTSTDEWKTDRQTSPIREVKG